MKTSKTIPLRCTAILVAATLFSSLTAAEINTTSDAPVLTKRDTSTVSHSDRSFIEKAAKAGTKEVEVSQAVADRVMDPQVKSFAQMMITDHTAANTELLALAARKGITIPADNMKASEKWSKKTKELDEDYIKEMKEDHEDAVKLFEKGSKADDPDIAAFAQKTLPTLQHHLTMVKELKKTEK